MSENNLITKNMVTENLTKANSRIFWLVLSVVYLTLILATFALLKHIGSLQFASLLRSQNLSISIQDWRQTLNGIASGWSLYPELKNICLFNNEQLVAYNFECSQIENAFNFFSGAYSFGRDGTNLVIGEFDNNLWPIAIVLPCVILMPAAISFLILRKPLIKGIYLDIANKIQTITLDTNNGLEKIIHNQMDQLIKFREQKKLFELARQVAHDIRSPLSALQILSSSGVDTTEKKELLRDAITRIRQVADDLLKSDRTSTLSVIDLGSLIKKFCRVKQVELSRDIQLIATTENSSYLVFANLEDLNRILSNIVNNSIEAKAKKIRISVTKSDAGLALIIEDDGLGFAKEVISALGTEQITYGKTSGNGIGLLHANAQLSKCNAKLLFSNLEAGAKVEILFPNLN